MSKLFARVHNGRVIEMNVSEEDIRLSGNSPSDYLPIYKTTPPKKIPSYHTLKEEAVVYKDHVRINYEIVPLNLNSLLLRIWYVDGNIREPRQNVIINTLDPKLIKALVSSANNYIQEQLDNFARQRGYEDIRSASTYYDSVVEQYAAEGKKAKDKRDLTWFTFYQYYNDVLNGVKPIPKNVDEIMSNCPPLTWD